MASQIKKKKKINKVNLWATIVSVVAAIGLIGLVVGVIVIFTLLQNKPTLNVSDFDQQESSIVYDSRGEEIANLGTVIRQNIEKIPHGKSGRKYLVCMDGLKEFVLKTGQGGVSE